VSNSSLSCPVCGYNGPKLREVPFNFCHKSCRIIHVLEQFEDQEKTSQIGWEVFHEGKFLLAIKQEWELSLTKPDILAITQILGDSKNQKSKFNSKFNSRYWIIHEKLILYFKESRHGRNL